MAWTAARWMVLLLVQLPAEHHCLIELVTHAGESWEEVWRVYREAGFRYLGG